MSDYRQRARELGRVFYDDSVLNGIDAAELELEKAHEQGITETLEKVREALLAEMREGDGGEPWANELVNGPLRAVAEVLGLTLEGDDE